MRRRIVIHNHLPVRARDAGPASTKAEADRIVQKLGHSREDEALKKVYAEAGYNEEKLRKFIEQARARGNWASKDAEPRPGDPDYKRWVEQQREEQNKRGGKFQANDLTRYQGDVIWIDVPEAQYNKLSMGSQIKVHGFTAMVIEKDIVPTRNGPNPRAKVRLQKPDAHDWGKRDSVGVVNREAEDRNRDKIYREAGIRRV